MKKSSREGTIRKERYAKIVFGMNLKTWMSKEHQQKEKESRKEKQAAGQSEAAQKVEQLETKNPKV